MNNKFVFTTPLIKQLATPSSKNRSYFYDMRVSGLELAVTAKGTKTFNVKKWSPMKHRPIRVTLGKFPDLTLENARTLASKHILEILKGEDPNEAKRPNKNNVLFSFALEDYLKSLEQKECKATTINNYKYFAKRFLTSLGDCTITEITAFQLRDLRRTLRDKDGLLKASNKGNKRPEKADRCVTANRVMRFISQIFNYAITKGWTVTNPTKEIKPFPESPSRAYLEEEELQRFFLSCDMIYKKNSLVIDFLKMCLFTGVRRRNVSSAKWQDFDLENKTWRIEDTKNNRPLTVYLSKPVMEMLNSRLSQKKDSDFVFPSSESSSGHLEEPKKGLKRVLKHAKISRQGLTIHSLKHTFVTYASESGLNIPIVKRLAGHSLPNDITFRYMHVTNKSIRDGYETVALKILDIANQNDCKTELEKAS